MCIRDRNVHVPRASSPSSADVVVKLVGGGTVAQGGRDPSDNKRMVATPAAALAPGSYLVEWTTTSADDGELARGTWTFTVALPPTPSPTPVATPAASATAAASSSAAPSTPPPTTAATPVPSADGGTSGSGNDVILPIVIALIVLGAGAAYLFSRRNRPATGA